MRKSCDADNVLGFGREQCVGVGVGAIAVDGTWKLPQKENGNAKVHHKRNMKQLQLTATTHNSRAL